MSEMVERLTKTISATGYANEAEARHIAAEVLRSMREPTSQMVRGGVTLEPTRNSSMVKFIYQGMMDAALK